MRTFTIDFTYHNNRAVFKSVIDDAGNRTPLIGRFGGVDFHCFHRLWLLDLKSGQSSLDVRHSLAINHEGVQQLGRLVRELPKDMIKLSDRFNLQSEKTAIRDCWVKTNLSAPLKLNREATVIRRLDGGLTYVRQIWGPGKLDMLWTEHTTTYRNGTPIPGSLRSSTKQTVLEDAHARAVYVLDENGAPTMVFVGDILDQDGRQVLIREGRWISNVELLLDARMENPFAGAEPYIWGDGRFEGLPLVTLEGDPAQFQADFSPLKDVRLHGSTTSGVLY